MINRLYGIIEEKVRCSTSVQMTLRWKSESTKRAFYNGRLDLTQAEALGDTLAAETEQQH